MTTTFSIAAESADKAEGQSGTTPPTEFTFLITRNGDITGSNTVTWAVSAGASPGANAADFGGFLGLFFPSSPVNFAPNDIGARLTLFIPGDSIIEGDENFVVTLSGATDGATIAQATANGVIRNDDVAPEVGVSGNSVNIADGDTTPSSTDHTDFGVSWMGGPTVLHVFTVSNTGEAPLTTSGLTMPAGYSIIDGLAATIAPGASDTIVVQLDTASIGTKSGQITFQTNDSDENPFNFSITGTVIPTILGDSGNNVLDGGAGAQFMAGGQGDDTYIVNDAGGTVIENVHDGTDTVQSNISWVLGNNLENLTLLGSASDGLGNELDNAIMGNSADNLLRGLGGADVIYGRAGNDWIEGESGNDPLPGGHVAAGDTLDGEAGDDTILAGGGDDVVYGGSGTDFLIGETGNDLMHGGSEWDAIDGRQGNDVLYGEGGNDIIFGDGYFYLFGYGNDILFGGDGDDIMMGEAGEHYSQGGDDVIYGEGGNDLLYGGGGNDVIYGGDGDDVIDGGDGYDYIVGGPGAEIMLGSNALDYGGPTQGSDLFVYQSMADAGNRIWGFDTRPGDTDGIDLRPLFDALGYAGTNPRGDGWLLATTGVTTNDTVVWIDPNGGGDSPLQLLTLYGVAPGGLTDSFFLFQ